MGTSHGDFIKYPRTPHLFGSKGTDDDKHMGEDESEDFIAEESLIAEEKIDGTNVGIHFSDDGKMVLRFILFGEWVYARHSIFYGQLTHYFFEFDIYDKEAAAFLDLEQRSSLLEDTGVETVPVVHSGAVQRDALEPLIGPSQFDSRFENPDTKRTDNLMEGLYLRIEANGVVTGRAKFVRPEFVEKIKQSTHWQHQVMVPNQLADDVDIWS
jgi:hypothetical protein